jgi:outer membrane protein, multidrug efflux system
MRTLTAAASHPARRGGRAPSAAARHSLASVPRPALLTLLSAAALAAGCATAPLPPVALPETPAPARFEAPLPHDGQGGELARWWQQFDDPLLAALIDAAQVASPDLAAAAARIEQARAARTGADALLGPTLDLGVAASRGQQSLATPLASSASAMLLAGWEIDLFGGNRAGADAAQARFEGAEASWHAARVSLAAEVAGSYTALRACESLLQLVEADAASRAETARLTGLAADAGFVAPANAALSRASAAQGRGLVLQQRARCELDIKALVALTAFDEPALRTRLAPRAALLPAPAQIAVGAVPAEVLAQRPDLYSAAREVVAAAADTAQQQAQRYPRVTLTGALGPARYEASGFSQSGTLWTLGPLQVSLPIFDGGARRANVEAARARYDAAAVAYRGRLRTAVREVEESLVALDSTAARAADAQAAVAGFEQSLAATDARYRAGLATLFELEDARRSALQSRASLIELQRERVAAWIALYRALGGGWSDADAATPTCKAAAGAPTRK